MAYKDWQELAEKEAYIPSALIDSIDYAERIIDMAAEAHGDSVDHLALEISKVLIKKAEYYRWHDLRKNPNDLPEHENDVEVVNDEGIHHVARYVYEEVYCYGNDIPRTFSEWKIKYCCYDTDVWDFEENGHIIAWREIEPFEEVNE